MAITTQLYEQQQDKAARFIPVIFSQTDNEHIPTLLRPTHRHVINTEKLDAKNPKADLSTENLYRHLAGMPRVAKPKIGQLVTLPPINAQDDFEEARGTAMVTFAALPTAAGTNPAAATVMSVFVLWHQRRFRTLDSCSLPSLLFGFHHGARRVRVLIF